MKVWIVNGPDVGKILEFGHPPPFVRMACLTRPVRVLSWYVGHLSPTPEPMPITFYDQLFPGSRQYALRDE